MKIKRLIKNKFNLGIFEQKEYRLSLKVPSPGNLYTLFTEYQKKTVTNLSLTGTVDARDIKFIRDDLTKLSVLNMSDVKIKAYNGNEGTCNFSILYPANEMPQNSFYDCYLGMPNSVLTTVVLPTTITSIGDSAFYNCISLSEFILPFSVVCFNKAAIFGCKKLANYQFLSQLVLVGEPSTVDNNLAAALVSASKSSVNQEFNISQ